MPRGIAWTLGDDGSIHAQAKSRRRRALDRRGDRRRRVGKYQTSRVQKIAAVAGKRAAAEPWETSAPIERITDQRMTGCREVNADLMRTSGLDPHLDQARMSIRAERVHDGAGPPSAGSHPVHGPEQRVRDRADRVIDREATATRASLDEAEVDPLDVLRPPRVRETPARPSGAGEQHHTRSTAPEAVHWGGIREASPHFPEERVGEETAGGHRGKPPRLRNRKDVGVGMEKRKTQRHRWLTPRRAIPDQKLAGA